MPSKYTSHGKSDYFRSKRICGISIHEISFWIDGLSYADKKNGRNYTFVDTSEGSNSHGGRWIHSSLLSGTIALGDINEYVSSIWFWFKPENLGTTETLVNFDGGTSTITRELDDIKCNIPNAKIYINGVLDNETDALLEYFVFVSWPVPILASNVTILSSFVGQITQIMGFTTQIPIPKVSEFFQLTAEEPSPTPLKSDIIRLEDGSDLLLETGYDFLLQSADWPPSPRDKFIINEDGTFVLLETGSKILQEIQL